MGQSSCPCDASSRYGLRRCFDGGHMGYRRGEHQHHGQAGLDESNVQSRRQGHRHRASIKGRLEGCIDVLCHPARRQTSLPGYCAAQSGPAIGCGKLCALETSSSAFWLAFSRLRPPLRIRRHPAVRGEAEASSRIPKGRSPTRLRWRAGKYCSTSTAASATEPMLAAVTTDPTCSDPSLYWMIKKVSRSVPFCSTAATGECRNSHSLP